ncbi:MAG: fibronectin type III domain-containing protein [Minisyncoccia bacterium]|jgi:hypothetical protein
MKNSQRGFITSLLLILLAVLLIGGGAYVYERTKLPNQPELTNSITQQTSSSSQTSNNQENQSTVVSSTPQSTSTTQGQSKNQQGPASITWNANPTLIRTIPFPSYQGIINIFNIGTIHGGEFDGKTVALGTLNLTGAHEDNFIYAYFVSDTLGTPLAWDSFYFHTEGTSAIVQGFQTALGFNASIKRNLAYRTISASKATIIWTTNEAATSLVNFGLSTAYGSSTSDPAYVTDHLITLTGLTASTTYHYQVISRGVDGKIATTTDMEITTSRVDGTYPIPNTYVFPMDLALIDTVTATDNKGVFVFGDGGGTTDGDAAYDLSDTLPTSTTPVAIDQEGWQIVKNNNMQGIVAQIVQVVAGSNAYYLVFSFGKAVNIFPQPDFLDPNNVPQLTWSTGTSTPLSITYGNYTATNYDWGGDGYDWYYCYNNISAAQFQAGLIVTGTTVKGDPIYELDPNKYPSVYDCLYDITYQGSSTPDFIQSHPMFFWRHPAGDFVAFIRRDVESGPGGIGKPVIYLYPPKPTEVTVRFTTPMRLTTDIPTYANGWDVMAHPDGELTDLQLNLTNCDAIGSTIFGSEYAQAACKQNDYPYLYWAGQASGQYPIPTGGWVVPQENISDFLNQKLTQIGLTDKEKSDMMAYWVPELLTKNAPFYRISFFQTEQMNQFIPMQISPKPDTVIRVFLDWSPLSTMPVIQPQPQILNHIDRTGFTLVEWGGLKQ